MALTRVILLCLVTHAVNAMYPMEYIELSRIPATTDFDSSEDAFADQTSRRDSDYDSSSSEIDEMKAEFRNSPSSDESEQNFYDSATQEDAWTEQDSNPLNKYGDSEENEALFSSESSENNKRDDYYDNLGKKSKRSFYIPPIRDFEKDELEVKIDKRNANREHHFPQDTPNQRSQSSKLSDYDNYYPKKNGNPDRESYKHTVGEDSYQASSSRHIQQSALPMKTESLQNPPARRSRKRRYHTRPRPIPIDDIRSVETSNPRSISPHPYSHKPAVQVQGRGYEKKQSSRRPAESYVRQSYTFDGVSSSYKPRPKSLVKESRDVVPRYSSVHADIPSFPKGYGKATREQFHEQGTSGPHSYKFGYNTGDENNPMARYEERGPDGIVRGSYSYVDALGRKQVVNYESHPKHGFRTTLNES